MHVLGGEDQSTTPSPARKFRQEEGGRWVRFIDIVNIETLSENQKIKGGMVLEDDKVINLKDNNLDRTVLLAKGVLGAAPVVGSIMAEVVGSIIPNQRIERMVRFVEILDKKLDGINQEIMRLKVQDEYFIDLLEDSMLLASRAITDERKEHIATIVKNSITNEQLTYLEDKRLLNILSELSDAEIIILQFHTLIGQEQRDFLAKHRDILEAPIVNMGSSIEEINRNAIHKTFKQNLVALNLLTPRYVKRKKNEIPEFDDKTGMMKATGYNVTTLGRLLLVYLDLKVGF